MDVVNHVKTQLDGKEIVIDQLIDALEAHPNGSEIIETVLQKPSVKRALYSAQQPFPSDLPSDDDLSDGDSTDYTSESDSELPEELEDVDSPTVSEDEGYSSESSF